MLLVTFEHEDEQNINGADVMRLHLSVTAVGVRIPAKHSMRKNAVTIQSVKAIDLDTGKEFDVEADPCMDDVYDRAEELLEVEAAKESDRDAALSEDAFDMRREMSPATFAGPE